MRDGTRRALRRGSAVAEGLVWTADPLDADAAWSVPLAFTLAELLPLPGEPPLGEDTALVAGIAVAGLAALAEGRIADGAALVERVVCVGGELCVVGSDSSDGSPKGALAGRAALAGLLAAVDPADTFGLGGALMAEANVDAPRFLVAAFAAFLAHERHVLVRRAAADRRLDALAALRALAHRLAGALPPPRSDTEVARCDGVSVLGGDGCTIWDGAVLDPRRARTAARALAGQEPEPAIRRWIVAMSRLRVDREILGRRGQDGAIAFQRDRV